MSRERERGRREAVKGGLSRCQSQRVLAMEALVLPCSHCHQSQPALDSPALCQPGRKTKFKSTGLLPGVAGCHHPPVSTPGPASRHGRHQRGSPHSLLRDKPLGTERGEPWLWQGSGLSGFAIKMVDFPASGFSVKRRDFLLVK